MKKVVLVLVATFFSTVTFAQADLRIKHFNTVEGLAIKGYDPVAYFTKNKAVEGKKKWLYVFEGITYYFSDSTNRATFMNTPKTYEPQYGGWCAFSMSNLNEKEDVDPRTFKILNGKLYLFYRTLSVNALNKWNKDEERLKPLGDINWTAMFR